MLAYLWGETFISQAVEPIYDMMLPTYENWNLVMIINTIGNAMMLAYHEGETFPT